MDKRAKDAAKKKPAERPRTDQAEAKRPEDLQPPKDKAGDVRGGPLAKR